MRTTLLIAVGFIMFELCLLAAQVFGDNMIDPMGLAIKTFVGLWLFAACANLWVKLMQPERSFIQEFPGFLAVFMVPVALALMLPWNLIAIVH